MWKHCQILSLNLALNQINNREPHAHLESHISLILKSASDQRHAVFKRRSRVCFLSALENASFFKKHGRKNTQHVLEMADLDAKAVALVYDFLLTKDKNFAEVFQSKFHAVSEVFVALWAHGMDSRRLDVFVD